MLKTVWSLDKNHNGFVKLQKAKMYELEKSLWISGVV